MGLMKFIQAQPVQPMDAPWQAPEPMAPAVQTIRPRLPLSTRIGAAFNDYDPATGQGMRWQDRVSLIGSALGDLSRGTNTFGSDRQQIIENNMLPTEQAWQQQQRQRQKQQWAQEDEQRRAWERAVAQETDPTRQNILRMLGPDGYAKVLAAQMKPDMPEGMRIGVNGPEWIPHYIEGRSDIARAGVPPMPAPPPGFIPNTPRK